MGRFCPRSLDESIRRSVYGGDKMITEHNQAPLHLILVVVALVMFGIAGFGWLAPIEPYRVKFIGIGLFFATLATFF
jgi:hypothetical protein